MTRSHWFLAIWHAVIAVFLVQAVLKAIQKDSSDWIIALGVVAILISVNLCTHYIENWLVTNNTKYRREHGKKV